MTNPLFEPSDPSIFKPSGFFDKDKEEVKDEVVEEETAEEPVEKIEAN